MKNRTRSLAVAGSAALLATLIGAAPAPAAPAAPKLASVHGAASVLYAYTPEDDIRFTVDAQAAPFSKPLKIRGGERGLPVDATGRVTVYHHSPGQNRTGVSEAAVDCLVTGKGTATVTATVTSSTVGWPEGKRIGVSVQDGERGEPDRVGFSWDFFNLDVKPDGSAAETVVGLCMAPAPFTTATKGGFKVTSAPLPPLPKP
ncbi:hypothetical protein ACLF6K_17740 [Streptomyces xanthophaeus]|uniref:hypothetical protein n=1 Tax=Streptomyces xanthophaeus TaxID=67385 RepID=UPI00398FADDE